MSIEEEYRGRGSSGRAYGWDAAMLDDPVRLLDALFDLNAKCAADPNYAPFGKNDKAPTLLDLSESEENEESR